MANSSKIKEPLKFGWFQNDQYHIAFLKKHKLYDGALTYFCLCNKNKYLSKFSGALFIWPDGINCTEVLCKDTVCKKCLKLYGEDLTFPLIKAKLGVKNPFD